MDVHYIVVHCSDSPDDMNVSAEDIHGWHLDNGWSGIGYHAVIERDGSIVPGRPDYWKGAHVRGHNSQSLGVCLVGRNKFERNQMYALRRQILEWVCKYPSAKIVGHCDLDDKKTCPNFCVSHWHETGEVKYT